MDNTLFGIPLSIWGLVCLGIAAVYFVIWPKPNPKRTRLRQSWPQIVLRYFHALVWVLLALACFIVGFDMGLLAWSVAMGGFAVYIYFMVVFVKDRNIENADLLTQRRSEQAARQQEARSEQAESTEA